MSDLSFFNNLLINTPAGAHGLLEFGFFYGSGNYRRISRYYMMETFKMTLMILGTVIPFTVMWMTMMYYMMDD